MDAMRNVGSGCSCCSRRRFLSRCASVTGAGALACLVGCENPDEEEFSGPPARIRVIYSLHAPVQPRPDWPNTGFDFQPVMTRINDALAKGCPGFTFLPTMAKGPEEAKNILAEDAKETATPVDGYLVYQMNCWNRVVQTIAGSGKPVLYADFLYAGSGGFLVYSADFIRKGAKNVGFMASSRLKDVVMAVREFSAAKASGPAYDFAAAVARIRNARTPKARSMDVKDDALPATSVDECVRRLRASKILAVRDDKKSGTDKPILEIPLEHVTFAEVNEAWKTADRDASKAVADRWQKEAKTIRDVSRETLETSAAMYLGMKEVLRKHEANAITINCLGGFYGGHIHAYPCLGFHELNNEGLVGGCECDIRSAASMLLTNVLTGGRPGFISDPVMDIAKRQIIYAHCVASNRVFGPGGPVNPFEILTHSEDRQGASVRSIFPKGYLTTTIEIHPGRKEILFHQAKAVDNDRNDRACRSKLCGEPVGDFEKLFSFWDQWGWHRVTVYGDVKEPVQAVADALGWKIVAEA